MSSQLEDVFSRVIGPDAMSRVRASLRPRPLILLGGDQLTGKTCTAQLLAARLGGEAGSTGSLVRQQLELEGSTLDAKNRHLAAHPEADVRLDFEALLALARGTWSVYECRMAGELGRVLREAGHPRLRAIYLTCGPRERAFRQVERSLGSQARARVECEFPPDDGRSLAAWLNLAVEILGPAGKRAIDSGAAASRDRLDRDRLLRLYSVDYTDTQAYDLTISTDRREPRLVADEVMRRCFVSGDRQVAIGDREQAG